MLVNLLIFTINSTYREYFQNSFCDKEQPNHELNIAFTGETKKFIFTNKRKYFI